MICQGVDNFKKGRKFASLKRAGETLAFRLETNAYFIIYLFLSFFIYLYLFIFANIYIYIHSIHLLFGFCFSHNLYDLPV